MRRLIALVPVALLVAAPALAVTDPYQPHQWGMSKIGATDAWSASRGAGVRIAVVDTGVHLAHEELPGKVAANVSCVESNGNPAACRGSGQDDDGHGTHVAGIAVAPDNGRGVIGVAPGAEILAVKVLSKPCDTCDPEGYSDDIIAGITWAVDNGAQVINLSLGDRIALRLVGGSSIEDGIRYAWDKGRLPVVAGGNDNQLVQLFPSGYAGVDAMIVAATNSSDRRSSYSNSVSDARYGIGAPGGEVPSGSQCGQAEMAQAIVSTLWTKSNKPDVYGCSAGTSMAAPHVSGAAAVLFAAGLNRDAVVQRLLSTADKPSGATGIGAGRLNVARASQGLGSQGASATTPAPTAPPDGGGGGGTTARRTPRPASAPASAETPGAQPAQAGEQTPAQAEPGTAEPSPDAGDPEAISYAPPASSSGRGGFPAAAAAAGAAALAGGAGIAWGLSRVTRRR